MMIIIQLNLFMCCYILRTKPFNRRKLNRIEAFNEIFNLITSVMLLNQSNFEDGEQLFFLGLQANMVILFMFMVNMIYVIGINIQAGIKGIRIKMMRKKMKAQFVTIQPIAQTEEAISEVVV